MPYKVLGKTVYVLKGGKWKALKTHESADKAKRHMRALYANVKEARDG